MDAGEEGVREVSSFGERGAAAGKEGARGSSIKHEEGGTMSRKNPGENADLPYPRER